MTLSVVTWGIYVNTSRILCHMGNITKIMFPRKWKSWVVELSLECGHFPPKGSGYMSFSEFDQRLCSSPQVPLNALVQHLGCDRQKGIVHYSLHFFLKGKNKYAILVFFCSSTKTRTWNNCLEGSGYIPLPMRPVRKAGDGCVDTSFYDRLYLFQLRRSQDFTPARHSPINLIECASNFPL